MAPSNHVPRCWACRAQLVPDQTFCVQCKHWQNWRKYAAFSSMTLALMIAFLSVAGVVLPVIHGYLNPPVAIVDIAGTIEHVCEQPAGCAGDEGYQWQSTYYRLNLTNAGGRDVLLAKRMQCNDAASDRFIDTGDEFASPTFFTNQPSLLKSGESLSLDYLHTRFEKSLPTAFHGVRHLLCAIAVDNSMSEFFVFTVYDREFFGARGVVDIGEDHATGKDLFAALKGDND